jgi:hypothetical protein
MQHLHLSLLLCLLLLLLLQCLLTVCMVEGWWQGAGAACV